MGKIWVLFLVAISSIEAVEIRGIVRDSQSARVVLRQADAVFQGEYAFNDTIYADVGEGCEDDFFRVRQYFVTRWKQKAVVVVRKVREAQGGRHQLRFEKEYDTLSQAEEEIPGHFSKECSFFRRGWEYCLGNMRVFVEEIEGLPASVEVIAPTKEEVFVLFNALQVSEVLTDSVPEWYCKAQK